MSYLKCTRNQTKQKNVRSYQIFRIHFGNIYFYSKSKSLRKTSKNLNCFMRKSLKETKIRNGFCFWETD